MSKVLIVEDNEMNRDMLSRRLERRGYRITIAIDGESGVASAKASLPDLILMDMSLPGLDGWEATKLLKADPATKSIPIIALTAHAMASDREKAMQAGCNDYDTKPVEISRLLTKIEKLLGGPPVQVGAPATTVTETVTAAAEVAEAPVAPAPSPAASGAKILIVEDNEMNRDMLSRRLERRGYKIVIAIDGEQGVQMARSEKPDLILMDMSLPGLDGWEASKLLKSDPSTASTPIIALTAHAMASDREKAMQSGCNDYDTKPVEISRLLGKIETWLSKKS